VYGIKGYNLSSGDTNGRYRNMEFKSYYVYILTNQSNRVLYTGVTNNLERRTYEHKNKLLEGFTKKYNCNKLVYYEMTESIEAAITREKQIKAGSRAKKIQLVETINLGWRDLSLDWV
jgi:putative endonuclease